MDRKLTPEKNNNFMVRTLTHPTINTNTITEEREKNDEKKNRINNQKNNQGGCSTS